MPRLNPLPAISRAFGRGVFPHRFSFLLELPARHLLLSPLTLARRLRLDARHRVLEVGAGSGFYSLAIAARSGYLVALDLQPEMLRKVGISARRAEVRRLACVAGDATALPFANESFTTVYMVAVFGEVSDSRALLLEIHRILEGRGTLSISEHLPDPDFTRESRLTPLVESHGFELAGRHGTSWTYTATFRKAGPRPPTL